MDQANGGGSFAKFLAILGNPKKILVVKQVCIYQNTSNQGTAGTVGAGDAVKGVVGAIDGRGTFDGVRNPITLEEFNCCIIYIYV